MRLYVKARSKDQAMTTATETMRCENEGCGMESYVEYAVPGTVTREYSPSPNQAKCPFCGVEQGNFLGTVVKVTKKIYVD